MINTENYINFYFINPHKYINANKTEAHIIYVRTKNIGLDLFLDIKNALESNGVIDTNILMQTSVTIDYLLGGIKRNTYANEIYDNFGSLKIKIHGMCFNFIENKSIQENTIISYGYGDDVFLNVNVKPTT